MALIKENSCICITCDGIIRFCTSDENGKRRHVAIVHGKETFSSLRCGKCDRKYYDMDHFTEHLETSPKCRKDSLMIKREPLSAHLEMAFAALVEQMMRPVETDQTEQAPISVGNGEGKMDRTSGETSKRSMDGAKRKRVDDNGAAGSIPGKQQTRIATRATNTIRKGKGIKNKKISMNIRRVRMAEKRKRQQRSLNASGGRNAKRTRKRRRVTDHQISLNGEFKLRPAIVRREYCLELIDKFSTAGKLECQLCSVEYVVSKRNDTSLSRSTARPMQHALGHLKKPVYRCQICNITKFMYSAIWNHIRIHHRGSEGGYEDSADQYHQQIMDMLGQCFDSGRKRPVEQGEHVSAVPGDSTEDKCVNGQFKLKPAVVRREYCLELIDKFSNAAKLQCQLCSAECTGFQGQGMVTTPIIRHALGHLKRPIFRCRRCNITKFTEDAIRHHAVRSHQESQQAYEHCGDQYHHEIMDMLGLCFDSHKKDTMEQVEKKMAIPGRCYDDSRSALYNERLQYIRRVVSHYPNQTRIVCQLCSRKCVRNANDAHMSVRNHIMGHVNKDIFQCNLCGTYCKAYYPLRTHMHKFHRLKNFGGAYMDHTDKYHQEFLNMLGKCFDPDSGNDAATSKMKVCSGMSGGTCNKATSRSNSTTSTVSMPADGKCFQCPHCQFRTKYEILMMKHSKVFHGH